MNGTCSSCGANDIEVNDQELCADCAGEAVDEGGDDAKADADSDLGDDTEADM